MLQLDKAKSAIICSYPFYASLLFDLPLVEDNSIPTMGTNGESIRYNTAFVESMTLKETVFVLCHEILHNVFLHMDRRGTRNFNKWNIAADYVINDLLVKDKVGTMPKIGLYDSALVEKAGGTAEGVYSLLPEDLKSKSPGQPGGSLDSVEDSVISDNESKKAQKEADMRVKVVQAANAAKMAGQLSEGIKQLVGELTAPKVDWRAVLRNFITARAKCDLSYARPKRRSLAEDVYLPGMIGEKMGNITIAVDTSGSCVTPSIINAFASEITGICQDVMPVRVSVLYFDTEICHAETFEQGEEITMNPKGGGGTAFSPIFKYIDEHNLEPEVCVVLTDLECDDFGDTPGYPVLWVGPFYGEQKVPFGEQVKMAE